jgi:hypothetical protein
VTTTEELILRNGPSWPFAGDSDINPHCLSDLCGSGLSEVESISVDTSVSSSHHDWVGWVRTSAPSAAALHRDTAPLGAIAQAPPCQASAFAGRRGSSCGAALRDLIFAALGRLAKGRIPGADIGSVRSDGRSERPRISEVPTTRAGRGAFVALVLVAILVALIGGSIPAAVAVLAVGGLALGAVLLARARVAERS